MFIKVAKGHYDESVYECDDYLINYYGEHDNPLDDSNFELVIEMNTRDEFGNVSFTVRIKVTREDNVFVMNNNGETIDKIM